MKEVWKDIPGFEGAYQSSSLGRVRSLRRLIVSKKTGAIPIPHYKNGKILRQSYGRNRKYLLVSLGLKARSQKVAHLVLKTFVGPRPAGYVAAHLNGTSDDNRALNLAWCTYKENSSHMASHGTKQMGEAHAFSVLSEETVRQIRAAYRPRVFGYKRLAKKFRLEWEHVRLIVKRKRWKHVK